MENTALVLDVTDNGLKKADLAAITMARRIDAAPLVFLINGDAAQLQSELEHYGAGRIVTLRSEDGPIPWHPETWAQAMAAAMTHLDIRWLLGLTRGRELDLLPRIAARLGAASVMDVLAVDPAKKEVLKSQFSGKATARFQLGGSRFVVGLRPNAIDPKPAPTTAEKIDFSAHTDPAEITIERVDQTAAEGVDLTEADIIISGGRAMQSADNFELLDACARQLGAAVGASRAAVDSGYAPHVMQVGQTGTTVGPKVYIACGISGAIQHFAGMKTAKTIVAINTDPGAAMVRNSDYAIIGDLYEIVPLLTAALAKRRTADQSP